MIDEDEVIRQRLVEEEREQEQKLEAEGRTWSSAAPGVNQSWTETRVDEEGHRHIMGTTTSFEGGRGP